MITTRAVQGRKKQAAPAGVAGIITEIRAEIAACRVCPAMAPHKKRPPESFGTTATGYMLVSDGPLATAHLEEVLGAVEHPDYPGLEDLFFLADAVRCQSGSPATAERRTCRPFLQLEIRVLRPRLILAVGAGAAEAVLGEPVKLTAMHGQRLRLRDTAVMPLLAPTPQNRAAFARAKITLESYRLWLRGLFGTLIETL